jgi:hypothetical protein
LGGFSASYPLSHRRSFPNENVRKTAGNRSSEGGGLQFFCAAKKPNGDPAHPASRTCSALFFMGIIASLH